MVTELYKVIKSIDASKLSKDDLEDLLKLFMLTENPSIRNHIAFLFGDAKFDKAVPMIFEKIYEKSLLNNNGSLVYALKSFDMRKHFLKLINIIVTQEYEPRLMAFDIVSDLIGSIPHEVKAKALKILEASRAKLIYDLTETGENSMLHFVEATIKLLRTKENGMIG